MSLTACISRCPATTRSPWFECLLLDVNRSSTEASACLICRKNRSAVSLVDEQHDPGLGAHAPDSDDLASKVGEPVVIEELT